MCAEPWLFHLARMICCSCPMRVLPTQLTAVNACFLHINLSTAILTDFQVINIAARVAMSMSGFESRFIHALLNLDSSCR